MNNRFREKRQTYRIGSMFVAIALMHGAADSSISLSSHQNAGITSAGSQNEVRQLEVDKPIKRELRGGESHNYEIALEAGHFLHAVVEQRGVDVVVQVIAPDGKPLMEVDSPNGTQGEEPVTLITEAAGVYRLTGLCCVNRNGSRLPQR